ERILAAGSRAGMDRTAARDPPQPQSAGAPRSRRHHRAHRRQQSAAGEHTAGYHRAYGRHPAVRRRDDEGGAGGRERKRSTAGRRPGSFARTGGPPHPSPPLFGAGPPALPPPEGVGEAGGAWVQMGGAIGREFSHSLGAAVVRKREVELQTALDRLIGAGLLLRQGSAPYASYSFKHVLVRDAAYSTLLREPRHALHARIAETLESQFAEISESQPELIAHHY